MKKQWILFTIPILLLICYNGLSAQELPQDPNIEYAEIKTKDGNFYLGQILSENEEQIVLKTESVGTISIQHAQIKKIKKFPASKFIDGKYWFTNPNSTRNLFTPTGYSLKSGEGYYQNFMVLINSANFGLTDHFTIGFGTIPLYFDGNFNFMITPKFSIPIVENKVNVAAGVLYARAFQENLGIAYGVTTFGSIDNNFTFGLGYGFSGGEAAKRPIITISGVSRVGRKFGLITENWIIPYSDFEDGIKYQLFATYGVRYIAESITVDFAFINNRDIRSSLFIGIPMVGVVIPFGNR